jgi:hypothetical protein
LPIRKFVKLDPAIGLLAALVVLGCSGWPTLKFDPAFGRSDWIEFRDSHPIDDPTLALAVTIVNRKSVPLWVRMEIDQIEGGDDCVNTFKLQPKTSLPYFCAQTSLRPGKRFRVQATVYKDAGNTKIAESINRLVDLERGDSGNLELVGRPAD